MRRVAGVRRSEKGASRVDTGFIDIAERLAAEFAELPSRIVIKAVTSAHDEHPAAHEWFIEEAVRARLSAVRRARFRESPAT